MTASSDTAAPNLDPSEVARFARIAGEWWDPKGKFAPLHRLGPTRMGYLRDRIAGHFKRSVPAARPLTGLSVLDIGCGGGLVAEPLARLGAHVTGIDPAEDNIAAARAHAVQSGLEIDYRATTIEALAAGGETFDAVLALEVVEHVPSPGDFIASAASLVRPGGLLVASTLNRTMKAFLLAIVGAEYVLRWLPAGTHRWDRFVTPDELAGHMAAAGMRDIQFEGMVYDPFRDRWSLSPDTDVNYFAAAAKAA
ncbi:MAG: bifunctional 2-polyprenyl-6-hydroxyphenol methylase/3-demethylubiquinol 3-O-methyltransferase UbiG [Proteobacteria bacterium]|nr:bifunctional 2-polyprenyl-6-hydroxyphenol methylase/3-demethylubiquinol 3-O-methyltransferase UbiG [Pseudomonadota bacterium]